VAETKTKYVHVRVEKVTRLMAGWSKVENPAGQETLLLSTTSNQFWDPPSLLLKQFYELFAWR